MTSVIEKIGTIPLSPGQLECLFTFAIFGLFGSLAALGRLIIRDINNRNGGIER